jgi:hypothetical protein
MDAGRRGAAALEPAHLLDSLVREDQGELTTRFSGAVTASGPIRPPHPFFSAETASEVLLRLEHALPPKAEAVPDSIDMPMSPALGCTFTAATELAKELHHNRVEPLHLLAALLSEKSSGVSEILKQVDISREAIIAAIRT